MGYDYPARWISRAGPDRGEPGVVGTAHHNVPDEILGHSRYQPEQGTNKNLLAYLKSGDRLPNIVLSSEGIATCISKATKLAKFAQFISAAKKSNDNVYVVLMFRNFARLIESWYLQKLKMGQMDRTLDEYTDEMKHWLRRLFRNIAALERTLGEDTFVAVDLMRQPSDAVTRLLSLMDVPSGALGEVPARLNERLGKKKAAILHRFQHSPDGKPIDRPPAEVARLVYALRKFPNFPDEDFGYRLISSRCADEIQEHVRKAMSLRWQGMLEESALPELGFHEAVDLANVKLSKDELSAVRKTLPHDMRDHSAFI